MMDRQALVEKLLTVLQADPPLPEYLGAEPDAVPPFDPYQLVAEWIALRHEVKQQGKLLQATQNTLQRALDALEAKETQPLSQPAPVSGGVLTEQKILWRDLLGVVDAIDQACSHWQAQIEALDETELQSAAQPQPFWRRWVQQWTAADTLEPSGSSLREVLVSNQEGVHLIRRSLLHVLQQRQVVPIVAQGQPFDPQTMYAVGRQETTEFPENTVLQEVVRGYLWQDQILREAQVIVAVRKA